MANSARPIPVTSPKAGSSADGLDEKMIRGVVDRFYAAAREDPVIGPVFKAAVPDERWRAHIETIIDFWTSMLLGSRRYEGRPLRKHLMLPNLEDAHFQRWLALFRRTVEELCPPAVAAFWADRAERIGNSFRISVRMHRGEEVTQLAPLERETLR